MNLLNEYGIKKDPRFIQAGIEARRAWIFIFGEAIFVFIVAYWGIKVSASEYTYILGMPMWFFWGMVGGSIIFPIWAIILAFITEDCSLTATLRDESKDNNMEGDDENE